MARVRADEETWATFRTLAGTRSISDVLGALVAQEVRRYRSQQLRTNALEPRELLEALERARQHQADLEILISRLETLAASTHSRCGDLLWPDRQLDDSARGPQMQGDASQMVRFDG